MSEGDTAFKGAIPEIYERLMVPMMFAPFAADLAARVAPLRPGAVLETAAGSGAVARALIPLLAPGTRYELTDLNGPMLEEARAHVRAPGVGFRVMDAQALDFPDGAFDAVLCQFGLMFLPDRPRALAEAHRVLAKGGAFFASVWDRLETNPLTDHVAQALAAIFPDDPPDFFARVPFGHAHPDRLQAEMAAAGFAAVTVAPVTLSSTAPSARHAAVALCQGTPTRGEIEARAPGRLDEITEAVAADLARRHGPGEIVLPIQALLIAGRA